MAKTTDGMKGLDGATGKLAAYVAGLRYEDLPAEVIDRAKVYIRDNVGLQVTAAAASEPVKKVYALVKEWGGAGQSTVVGYGLKAPMPNAVLCNAAMGHGLQLDDSHDTGLIKPGSVAIPAAFGVSELTGATGKDAITAIVVGYDIAIRLGKAVNPGHRRHGFHTSGTVGAFAGAAVAAKMLGCDAEAVEWALGLAGSQAAGTFTFLDSPCMEKPFGMGKAAYNGVLAGLLAKNGFVGPQAALESNEGFFNTFTDAVDLGDLLDGLGDEFAILENGFKIHSACRYSHGPIDLAQKMYHEDGVRLVDVDQVNVYMSEVAVQNTSVPECPTLDIAGSSTQFAIAVALAKGFNSLPENRDGFDDPAVHAALPRIKTIVEPEFGALGRQAIVEVKLKDGRTLSRRQEQPRGEPTVPFSAEEIDRKYYGLAGLVMEDAQMRELSQRIMELENAPEAGVVPQLTVIPEGAPTLRAA